MSTTGLPSVQFDRSRATPYVRKGVPSTVNAFLVLIPDTCRMVLAFPSQRMEEVTGSYYAFYDKDGLTGKCECTGVLEQAEFECSYEPTQARNEWRRLPVRAQQVTVDQLRGTSGMLVNQKPDGGMQAPYQLVVGEWLILQNTGYVNVMDARQFRRYFAAAESTPTA